MEKSFFIFNFLILALFQSVAVACPFCSENLAKNNGGFTGGLTIGIVITIFFLLGILGTLVSFIVYSIRQGDKRTARRRELAAQETPVQA